MCVLGRRQSSFHGRLYRRNKTHICYTHTHHRRDNGMHWITYVIYTHTPLWWGFMTVSSALSFYSAKAIKTVNRSMSIGGTTSSSSRIRNNNNNIVYCRENGLHKYISQMVIASAYTSCRYLGAFGYQINILLPSAPLWAFIFFHRPLAVPPLSPDKPLTTRRPAPDRL